MKYYHIVSFSGRIKAANLNDILDAEIYHEEFGGVMFNSEFELNKKEILEEWNNIIIRHKPDKEAIKFEVK